jgi:hypothetical protein
MRMANVFDVCEDLMTAAHITLTDIEVNKIKTEVTQCRVLQYR